jgi:hypothetical protein
MLRAPRNVGDRRRGGMARSPPRLPNSECGGASGRTRGIARSAIGNVRCTRLLRVYRRCTGGTLVRSRYTPPIASALPAALSCGSPTAAAGSGHEHPRSRGPGRSRRGQGIGGAASHPVDWGRGGRSRLPNPDTIELHSCLSRRGMGRSKSCKPEQRRGPPSVADEVRLRRRPEADQSTYRRRLCDPRHSSS